jgi:putative endonuclease
MAQYCVYLLTNRSRTLYTGVTNDLLRRLYEHRHPQRPCFTSRYRVTRLVYYEATPSARTAIAREQQIKSWSRPRKIALIRSVNPRWRDLSRSWYPATDSSLRSE